MSEDSGQQPQPPADQPGYWEQKAAEDAASAPQLGPLFNPQSAAPVGDQAAAPSPYPPAYPTAGVANPYAGGYAPPPPGWAPQPGMSAFPVYAVPDLPRATTSLVLGIIAVAGTFICVLPVVIAPIAWVLGAQARRQIRSAPQQWGGEGRATAGMVLGIIGTALLVLGVVAIVVLIAVAMNDPTGFDSDTGV